MGMPNRNKTMKQYWADVENALQTARYVEWDDCHKIYVVMDDFAERREIKRRGLRSVPGGIRFKLGRDDDCFRGTPTEMMAMVRKWWKDSWELS